VAKALVQAGQLEQQAALDLCRRAQAARTTFLAELTGSGAVSAADLAHTLSAAFGVPLLDLDAVDTQRLPKDALVYWSAKVVSEWVADNPEAVEQLRTMGRGPMVAALKGVPWEKRDQAAVRGTDVHALAEQVVHGVEVEVPAHLVDHVTNYARWLDELVDWNTRIDLTAARSAEQLVDQMVADAVVLAAHLARSNLGHQGVHATAGARHQHQAAGVLVQSMDDASARQQGRG
jgi:hypothetical protein